MFNNDDPNTNGEIKFISSLPKHLTIFDVGSRDDSWFLSYEGTVHYFEPNLDAINRLKYKLPNKNIKSYFNSFGLSNYAGKFKYFPHHQSFVNRINSTSINDEKNAIELQLETGKNYIKNLNISKIDFLKIDVEGLELNVLKGFEDFLNLVELIQFEYGGTFLDANVKLSEIINWLKEQNYQCFYYVTLNGLVKIENFEDHYQYCNIICSRNSLLF